MLVIRSLSHLFCNYKGCYHGRAGGLRGKLENFILGCHKLRQSKPLCYRTINFKCSFGYITELIRDFGLNSVV
jgi:hypothetical protein